MYSCDISAKRRKIIASGEGETSSVSAISKNDYEVFLSFRGPDTRQGFTDCLYHALVDAGIRVFRDDDELRLGDKLDEILRAIDNSKICVIVLSRTYAASAWCLREVERIVNMKKDIVPIFYDVTPDDVKLKTQIYAYALPVHEAKYEKEQIQQWREALKEIPTVKGRELKNSGFAEFSKQIVKEILTKLKVKHKYKIENLVEVPDEVESALEKLDIGSGGRRFLGIHGMGGIGKTTLAKNIFNQVTDSFDCSCFLENIREYLSRGQYGLQKLQKQLLKSLDPSLPDSSQNFMEKIENNFTRKKVIIVLDDIDEKKHIHSLVGDSSSFGTGSRIIFTTRNTRLHEQETSSDTNFYGLEKKEMDSKQALKLFSRHAFGIDSPPEDYKNSSNEVIAVLGGLPLALEVVGSFLCRQKAKVWRSAIRKLKGMPDQAVQQKLKLSYDALEIEQQEIFLDIACFFIGEDKTDAVYMWEACGFHPDHGIEVLTSMSLIKIKDNKHFWMHDQLRDFGRAIVRGNSEDRRAGSRIWMNEDALGLLKRNTGKEKAEALDLAGPFVSLDHENLVGFENLRFLRMKGNVNFTGDFVGLIPKLKWLSSLDANWSNATNLCFKELVVLHLGVGRLTWTSCRWSQIPISEHLKVLTLSGCDELISMPDLSKLVNLERLALHFCLKLTSIHSSVGMLRCLKRLTLTFCDSLHELPEELTSLKGLKHFVLDSSRSSRVHLNLPESIGRLISLTRLVLRNTGVTKLPSSIGELVKLKHLSLKGCINLKVLPDSIGDLRSLVSLDLECTGITEMPDSFGDLESLVELDLRNSEVRSLPDSIRDLKKLQVLCIGRCFGNGRGWIEDLHDLPTGLTRLEIFEVKKIKNLSNLMSLSYLEINNWQSISSSTEQFDQTVVIEGIDKLSKLKHLDLQCHFVESLPMELDALHQLRSLTIHCWKLEFMQCQLPSSLESLDLEVKQWGRLPINLSSLKNLSRLSLINFVIEEADNGIEGLESLENLSMSHCDIKCNDFPMLKRLTELRLKRCHSQSTFLDISRLDRLDSLDMFDCKKVVEIPGIGKLKSLTTLYIEECGSLQRIEDLSELKQLESVMIRGCPKLEFMQCQLPSSLKSLDLEVKQWGRLPINLSSLKNLSRLSLKNFVIEEADNGIEVLEFLENLQMSQCDIKFNDFPMLKRLTELQLMSCHSQSTFLDISRLDRLDWLVMFDCKRVVEIPGIGKLKSLTTLEIDQCGSLQRVEDLTELKQLESVRITDCPNLEFMQCQLPSSLKSLNLEVKQWGRLPINLSSLKNLSRLSLMNFVIEEADNGIEGLESLENLSMSHCDIKFNDFSMLKRLTKLELKRCHSQSTLPGIGKLKALTTLCIEECGSLQRIEDLSELKQLESVMIRGYPKLEFMQCQLPSSLKSLDLEVKQWGRLPINLSSLKNLSRLSLKNFVIEEADNGIEVLESLENLQMSQCDIKFNDFPMLKRLTELQLMSCHSQSTFLDISRLDRLDWLVMFDCKKVVEIPGIGKLKSLTALYIDGCGSLQRIEDLSELKKLKSVTIRGCTNFQGIDSIDSLLLSAETVRISGCKCQNVGRDPRMP